MTVETRLDEPRGQFPVGMRVLAVDDDPTCLFVLENLLRKCQYHVTATNQAITALKMLRENKNKFDLVISDVHMPDMDGFKLLELVGLEMDLPVIMLSANGDTKLVMKGITHGACDYLLKPVRIEELKNIWQHVIRRKKFDSKEKNNTCNQDQPNSGSNNGIGSAGAGNSDQNGKLTKKRKDQDDEDDEDHENGHDNDDPSAQKKPRVVWSVELHRKFVAAVNQLGIDKAVPKKILDLMNVEKLTRENVASHLQKYRLYLKRISCVANQQANMVAALGSADPSYLRVGSLSGIKHLQPLNGSGQFQNNIFRSHIPYSGMIGRLNTPAGLGVNGLPSSGILQLGHAQNLNSSMNDTLKFQPPIAHHLNHTGGTIQGMPVSMGLELDQLHPNKVVSSVQAPPTAGFDDKTIPPPISNNNVPPDPRASRVASSCSRTPLVGITNNNALMLEPVSQDKQRGRGFENNLASVASSQHSEFPLPLLDNHNPNGSRCSDTWASAVQSSGMHANSYSTTNECFHVGNPSGGASSITSLSSQSHDSMADMHSQGPIFTNHTQNVAYQGWDDPPLESLIPANGVHGPSGFHRNLDFNFGNTLEMKHEGVTKPPENNSLKSDQGYIMETQKLQRNRISNNLGSLEDLVSAMMKQEQDKVRLVNGNFICDDFSGGTSI